MHPDIAVLHLLNDRPAALLPVALGFTYLGAYGGLWLLIGLANAASPPRRTLGLRLLLSLVLVLVVVDFVLKPLVDRPRPFALGLALLQGPVPGGAAFPSGHAAAAFAGFTAWVRSTKGRLWQIALLYALAVSWSRLYLGVHWPSDVLAGVLIGSLCGYVSTRLLPGQPHLGGAD